ncbi:hypothetical protein A2331_05490 [Candidatus Falkowbacteria bacterium RIFOXYB2_FULL_34_18]|uniref:Transcription regulator TrmB N-terminal domain-containing protein n=1 Tax=Candidatus Falkowbacteria bacterium RIFOXYD2_FULL_34_120 TaxID=1798007 RepID=A0A1F5TRC6_9BACT|nr:MAG: hypothetical protein A2331_05490 [Candidatus Falkowbacteria bacterium RIFOXYB2_FULL_34_18]OGF29838.1 MAG: hypothetical protein A2500_01540 [Candidatus Falkowbacteria bacterium RIFOXYC12_FULL_34_55]OGF37047.1 MAG: hypothetical protein A2466_05665 [Candidatus Falkowbacteria bacterium RIFOXYC2_FULL_34_220]OGF39239.1 MAG: hypothetical protein A2515_00875 [Candidatus Falkowbacteria bacterium RIFOXYD12_FULL_34_57]OGF41344.1 MAG: hypothetical protein A2531_07085 [Candidatus Falkowbacteria bact
MDVSILKKLDLGDKEIKVYLGLLEYGAISVRGLADLTNLNRGSVYDILKKLQEDGLVSFYHHATKQKFTAEDPEKLETLLIEKEKELQSTKQKIQKIIPELKSIQDKGGNTPTTKFYEGRQGIKTILEDILDCLKMLKTKEKEYYVYSATEASDDINSAFPNFTQERIKNKIKVKVISLARGGKTSGLDERRWLGTEKKSATFIIIYAGKCAFISRDAKGVPVGVIIENKMIYNTQKIIFGELWRMLKK